MDKQLEQRQIARTVRELVNLGFTQERGLEAAKAIGDKTDVQMAYNWLLDHGEEDKGGAVNIRHCSHLGDLNNIPTLASIKDLKYGEPCSDGCGSGENWVCLHCGVTRCSRYVKSHNLAHYEATKQEEEKTITIDMMANGRQPRGHYVALSLSDMSVWCYECGCYIEHEFVQPLLTHMQKLKFGEQTVDAPAASSSSSPAPMSSEGQALQAKHSAMHGFLGDTEWEAPQLAVVCNTEARPNYQTCLAHEYLDTDQVLREKVKLLASLIQNSSNCVAYTGAGISTASGIQDYATKTTNSLSRAGISKKVSGFDARPTLAHHVLTSLYKKDLLKYWVQQNHDGLPQKAGFPQKGMNEIHGAWYDVSNPVVPMSGTLRDDLIEDLCKIEDDVDLCLAMGSSMCGMNADRVAVTPAQKARKGRGIGTVIVSLQCTQYDEMSTLRIFARIDDVMRLLAEEMGLEIPTQDVVYVPPSVPASELTSRIFTNLPYNDKGYLDKSASLTLNLTKGAKVRVVNQPKWDYERVGGQGQVVGFQEEGHFKIRIGPRVRVLGLWWLEAAKNGEVDCLPVINC